MTKKDYVKFANMIIVMLDRELKTVEENPAYKLRLTPIVSVSHIIEEMIKIFKNDNSRFSETSFRNFIKFDTYQSIYNDKLKDELKEYTK